MWAAADALISEGLKPTIERVRHKIGRGSPNTVSPMLEAWFATLASRLGVDNHSKEDLPIPLTLKQGLEKLWEMALVAGKEEADKQIAQANLDLSLEKVALQVREDELFQQQKILAARQESLEDALFAAVNKAEDLASRLNQMQLLTNRREEEIEALRRRLAAIEDERSSERHRMDEKFTMHSIELQRQAARAESTQHKLLEDIDKARQETKKTRIDAQAAEKLFERERSLSQQKIQSREIDLIKTKELHATQTSALRNTLEASNFRSDELRDLLENNQIASNATIARLTDALSVTADRQPERKPLVRKVKQPIRPRKI